MALQSPFFGKRDNEPTSLRHGSPNANPYANGTPAAATSSAAVNTQATPVQENAAAAVGTAREGGSKLTVGPNIKLKGVEITDCDTLVVEGLVEATMDSRVIQIAEHGAFKGSAEIDIAEIHGEFDGNLTVRQKLVIYATGKVTGKIRYGKLVIEEGGQLAGEILYGAVAGTKAALVGKPGLQVA
ncbi:MAG: polymer-forming cytoskeletal protein [Pseudomonadota bacterium]|uniref:bactofilin family protein n=1 Tax=Polaromonas sp. TaxID=1869339 RepID=UPI0018310B91|nr:polymer-forming cytoskeletal protein [Polaromonas sp.]MBA3592488.1 polymer-forming cytoskeletal protein [Polaromonas sp.]MDQ3272366.1 polymer-forming cytoskeletal protein [Pseudomonadota bacterium]